MEDLEFLSPNGGAYEQGELRTGPPLDYVGEKLRSCIETIHSELTARGGAVGIRAALMYGVTSYLALYNMLALTHRSDLFDRIEAFSRQELGDWLDRVRSEGSVRG